MESIEAWDSDSGCDSEYLNAKFIVFTFLLLIFFDCNTEVQPLTPKKDLRKLNTNSSSTQRKAEKPLLSNPQKNGLNLTSKGTQSTQKTPEKKRVERSLAPALTGAAFKSRSTILFLISFIPFSLLIVHISSWKCLCS